MSSTLTTVVVFAPLGFLSGVVGAFFAALALALAAAVLLSLVDRAHRHPVLSAALLRAGARRARRESPAPRYASAARA